MCLEAAICQHCPHDMLPSLPKYHLPVEAPSASAGLQKRFWSRQPGNSQLPCQSRWVALRAESPQRRDDAGHHLARLPVDPRIGKLLLLAAVAGCLAPALSVAAALSYKSPFLSDDAATQAKRAIAAPGELRSCARHYLTFVTPE